MLRGDAPLYNIGGYIRLTGPLAVYLFIRSVELLVQKHDVLRTVLIEQDPERDDDALPLQTFADVSPVIVPFHDSSSDDNPHEAAMTWMRWRFSEPFALQGEPLFRYPNQKIWQSWVPWLRGSYRFRYPRPKGKPVSSQVKRLPNFFMFPART